VVASKAVSSRNTSSRSVQIPLEGLRGAEGNAFPFVGADIVEIAQIAQSMETFGDRYLRRVFTEGELAYCLGDGRTPDAHLAARFAAKEATFKALRAGTIPFDWRWIEVVQRRDGSCGLRLHGGMRTLARRRGARSLRVSLSHDGAYAIAVVVGASRTRVSRRSRAPRATGSGESHNHD
jgi:holo-[acyl-carrier protein] synthase